MINIKSSKQSLVQLMLHNYHSKHVVMLSSHVYYDRILVGMNTSQQRMSFSACIRSNEFGKRIEKFCLSSAMNHLIKLQSILIMSHHLMPSSKHSLISIVSHGFGILISSDIVCNS